jgi:hypothetical protein
MHLRYGMQCPHHLPHATACRNWLLTAMPTPTTAQALTSLAAGKVSNPHLELALCLIRRLGAISSCSKDVLTTDASSLQYSAYVQKHAPHMHSKSYITLSTYSKS